MALDKIVDSEKLEIGLSDTAGLLGEFFAALCGDSSIPTFDWEIERVAVQGAGTTAAGFAKDIYEYLATHYSGSGSSGGSGVTVKSGSVTLSTARQTIEVTPESGKTPIFAVVEMSEPRYGTNGTIAVVYSKLPIALNVSSRYQNGYFGVGAQTANNNATNATANQPNTSETWINVSTGKITFTGQSGYQFLLGTYNWYAIYGEVYS